jgi:hypothetical protein
VPSTRPTQFEPLLDSNHQRHAQEIAAGLHEMKAKVKAEVKDKTEPKKKRCVKQSQPMGIKRKGQQPLLIE